MTESFALEAQLRSVVRIQLENTKDGLKSLGESSDALREAGDALERVANLCRQSEQLIDNYAFIKTVSRTHQNFTLTRRVYEEFCQLDAKMERCAVLLDADVESGLPDNILLVHLYLSRLEGFRRQTLDLMQNVPSTAIYTIKRYFKRLDDLLVVFSDFFWKLPSGMLAPLEFDGGAARLSPAHIVSMAKVLKMMGADEKTRFDSILNDFIDRKFSVAASAGDLTDALDEISGFWVKDLQWVRDELVAKFPLSMNIMDFFTLHYHRRIHAIIAQRLSSTTEEWSPAEILSLIGWVQDYESDMAEQLGYSLEHLEPPLLTEQELNKLINHYMALSRSKMNEWVGNLLSLQISVFQERSQLPETDAENLYMTPAGIDLFQIVKQYIDTASQASKGKLLSEMVSECSKAVKLFTNGMSRTILAEGKRHAQGNANPLLEEYTIMLGNTCLSWIGHVKILKDDLETVLESEFISPMEETLASLQEAFLDVAKNCTQLLVQIIFNAVQPAIQQLFTPTWYTEEGQIIATIMATFDDFFADYRQHADAMLLNKLVGDVLERMMLSYLGQLRALKTGKLRLPDATGALQSDSNSLYDFFARYRDEAKVKKIVDPFSRLLSLLSSPPRMLFLDFVSSWKLYPDMTIPLFEEFISKRDDLDRTTVKEVIESCRKKTVEEKLIDIPPSLFSKLATK